MIVRKVAGVGSSNDSKSPLYEWVKNDLLARIGSGDLKTGDMLPSEEDLCRAYGVSRITVKRALVELVNEGLITRRQGKGTFVAAPNLEEDISLAVAVARPVIMHGDKSWHKVLSAEVVLPLPDVSSFLQIEPTDHVIQIERLKMVDDKPLGYERTYVPEGMCPGLNTKIQNGSKLIYELLAQDYGISLVRAKMFIEPTVFGYSEAKLLDGREGMPAMLWQRTTYTTGDRPVEYFRAVVRGDRFKYYLEFPGKPR
jgi:GntR family transcriptional regulator